MKKWIIRLLITIAVALGIMAASLHAESPAMFTGSLTGNSASDVPPRSGHPLDDTGGPDDFGYRFVDNLNGDSASYDWIDLTGNATWLPADGWSSHDDGYFQTTLPLGMDFPFYGSTFTDCWVGTNGYVSFIGPVSGNHENCIPNGSDQPMLQPLQDDLHLDTGGHPDGSHVVGYENFGSYTVIVWDSVGFANPDCAGGSLTFQIILFNDGRIKFQYRDLVMPQNCVAAGTVGIQQGTMEQAALQYRCYPNGERTLSNGRAIWFVPRPPGVDFVLTAPGTVSGNTCGAEDNCNFRPHEDQCVEVTIPSDGGWTFTLCNNPSGWDTYLLLSSGPCAGLIAQNDDWCGLTSELHNLTLTAGTYYVTIDAFSDACGAWQMDVIEWALPTGRCCYGDPFNPVCQDFITEPDCQQLAGDWASGMLCMEPCYIPPPCPDGTMFGQPRPGPDNEWSAYTSDVDSPAPGPYAVAENFSGITEPIGLIRVWGLDLAFQQGWAECDENPMPMHVEFRADNNGQPGAVIATYETIGTAEPGIDLQIKQFDMEIDPPLFLESGFVSIAGAGDPDCWFLWLSSPEGDLSAYQWQGSWVQLENNLAICLAPAPCDPVTDLTVYRLDNDPPVAQLRFTATAAGDYVIYSTTERNNDGDPRENDPDWIENATVTAAAGLVEWTDPNPLADYRNYVVIHDCTPQQGR